MKPHTDAQALTSHVEAQTSLSQCQGGRSLARAIVAVHRRFSHVPAFQKHTVPLPKFYQQLRKTPCTSSFPSAAHCHHRLYMLVPSKVDNFPVLPSSPAYWLLILQESPFFHANSSIKIQVHFSVWFTARPCKVTFPFGGTRRRMTPFTLALILMGAAGRRLFFISLQVRQVTTAYKHVIHHPWLNRVITALMKESWNGADPNLLLGATKCYVHL